VTDMKQSMVEVLVPYPAIGDERDGVYLVSHQTRDAFRVAHAHLPDAVRLNVSISCPDVRTDSLGQLWLLFHGVQRDFNGL
jgi:hypothetical protein